MNLALKARLPDFGRYVKCFLRFYEYFLNKILLVRILKV